MQKSWTPTGGFNFRDYGKGGSGQVPNVSRRGTDTSRAPSPREEPAGKVFQPTAPWRRRRR
jgi:hypothetical protein